MRSLKLYNLSFRWSKGKNLPERDSMNVEERIISQSFVFRNSEHVEVSGEEYEQLIICLIPRVAVNWSINEHVTPLPNKQKNPSPEMYNLTPTFWGGMHPSVNSRGFSDELWNISSSVNAKSQSQKVVLVNKKLVHNNDEQRFSIRCNSNRTLKK